MPDLDTIAMLGTFTCNFAALVSVSSAAIMIPLAPATGYFFGKEAGFKDRISGARYFWDVITKADLLDYFRLTPREVEVKYAPHFRQFLQI
jgi:hypothetical protein